MGLGNNHAGLDDYAVSLVRHHAAALVRRGGLDRADRDDIEQELALHLVLRLPRFDPARASRRTFAARVVAHRAATLHESGWTAKETARRAAVSLHEETTDADGRPAELWRTVDDDATRARRDVGRAGDDADLRIDVAAAIASLPPEHQAICAALACGSTREAARTTGIPRRTLRGHVAEIRAHFLGCGLADYASSPPPIRAVGPVCNQKGHVVAPLLGRTA